MSETIRLTTAQALIKFLNYQYICYDGKEVSYIEGLFHIFGHGNVLSIGQALEENIGHLKSYSGKNEQGMAHTAIAYTKQNLCRKIFAISTSAGPGSANLITAAATAFANNIPILLLPSDTFSSRQPDPVLQQLEHYTNHTLSTNDAFQAVSRYWDRIHRPEQLMQALLHAFEIMTNPSTMGPTTICIPQDTAAEAFDYPIEFFDKRVHYIDRVSPSSREIDGIISMIRYSKLPVIIIGGGAKYSEAGDVLEKISLMCDIPLVETHAGKSTVISSFTHNLGGVGILGTSAANKIVQMSDLIIGLGTRYTDFVTASKTLFDIHHTAFINININRMQTYKLDGFQVVADAKSTIEAIIPLLVDYKSAFGSSIAVLRSSWEEEKSRLKVNNALDGITIKNHFSADVMQEYKTQLRTQLSQASVVLHLNDMLDHNAIVVGSAGSLPGDMQRLWSAKERNTFHLEYGYSCMGYEIAGALGAKLAEPSREVYALVGDGSFLMLHTELVTALQYHYKINIVLFNNAGYGCINNLQMDNGCISSGTEFRNIEDQIMNIDYAKIAEGYGLKSYQVTSIEALRYAVIDAKKADQSTLIEIKVLPKTMTDGYEGSWWNVGIAEVSHSHPVQQSYFSKVSHLSRAKKY
ncbi:3D-(3,5/4)-trihydroxycyclohexane-1,2-dione acylhydrolase (decyclizing) (plasmid) [Entomospira nematocerorum]|uniref:3D-(3,5/4)-trihydroxycyclohexane-1,2-dione acylhydrolase (Decyclizing) n=1 Tax=Entomospira nematocerorum TaxID=2719987 RepID=A0A968KUW6_9SPIO|nr:3D-(3,5/4)-trihydroxycyclohexane-1,2-dione acylhydrolase (decyclizing) [Entomospira nematocera]NIZ47719.1 3D-(3,5/4)-trihydroxycyclohexane-1,2-dione acylhydrolase (decyclizing) [Entomospira nematocera]WDI34646.1 3D-(3,5/4)-trihydroxycyclohexane-1,2-dione acylhydrolase (decyclizing) [Entomospira nematocera]